MIVCILVHTCVHVCGVCVCVCVCVCACVSVYITTTLYQHAVHYMTMICCVSGTHSFLYRNLSTRYSLSTKRYHKKNR